MPARVPEAVREAWGDELVAAVVPWLEEIVEEKAVPHDEYRQVLSRLDNLEHDITDIKIETTEVKTELRDLRREMSEIKTDLHEVRREMNGRFDRMYERFVEMDRHFEGHLDQMTDRMLVQTRWLIGSIVLFGTILSILMAIGQLVR